MIRVGKKKKKSITWMAMMYFYNDFGSDAVPTRTQVYQVKWFAAQGVKPRIKAANNHKHIGS